MAESFESSAEKDVGYGNGPQGHGHGYDISYAPKVKVVKVEKPAPVHSYDPAKENKKEENMEESSEEKIVEHGHGYGVQHDPKIHVVKVENVVRPAASYSYGVGYGYGHGQGHQYVAPKEKKMEEKKEESSESSEEKKEESSESSEEKKEESSESSEEKKEESSESSEEKIVGYRHGYRHGYRYGIPYEKPAPVHSYGHGYGYGYGHGHRYGPVKDETKEEKKEESSESSEEKMEGYGHGYGVPHARRVHVVKLEKIIKPAPSYSYVINGGYGHHYEAPKEEKVEEKKKESSESSEEKIESYGHEYRRGYAYGVPHAPGVHVVKVEKVIKPAPSYSYGIGHHGYGHHGHGYRHGYGNGFVYAPRTEVVKPTPSYSYGHGYYGHGYGHGHGRSYFTPAAAKKVVVQEVKVSEPKGAAPYKFGYDIVDEHGNKQSRHESGDAAGNKKGSYTFDLVDGRKRIVDYVADGNGFKAVVRSNEPGTDPSKDPADVQREPLGEPLKVVEASKAPEPVKEVKDVKVAPSYGYGAGHYDHHGHGHGYGNGYGHRLQTRRVLQGLQQAIRSSKTLILPPVPSFYLPAQLHTIILLRQHLRPCWSIPLLVNLSRPCSYMFHQEGLAQVHHPGWVLECR
ncbi:Cuticle protein 10.9 [Nymphon striatum]|nr:Cuticle protein 10.9 [Nymphon striatum]